MTTLSYAIVSAVIAIGIIAASHAVYAAVLFQINGGF